MSPEVERLVTTVSVTSETTNSNSLLHNTASTDIQQHVSSANSGDVDNDSQSDCHSDSDSCAPEVMVPDVRVLSSIKNEKKYGHGYMTVSYTKSIYVSFVNCFVVILPHHKNLLLLALILVQYDRYSITGYPN
jgi:hypothetical protein